MQFRFPSIHMLYVNINLHIKSDSFNGMSESIQILGVPGNSNQMFSTKRDDEYALLCSCHIINLRGNAFVTQVAVLFKRFIFTEGSFGKP